MRRSRTQLIGRLSEAYTASSQKAGSFDFSKKIQQHNGGVAMNVVLTSHQLVYLCSPIGDVGFMLRRRRSYRKKWSSAEAVCIR
jgi:hypothetical protein